MLWCDQAGFVLPHHRCLVSYNSMLAGGWSLNKHDLIEEFMLTLGWCVYVAEHVPVQDLDTRLLFTALAQPRQETFSALLIFLD